MYQNALENRENDLLVPLVAIAWPHMGSEELIRFYGAFAILLSEDFDLLILHNSAQSPADVTQHLHELNVTEDRLIFMECEVSSLGIRRNFELSISKNVDGAENISVISKSRSIEEAENIQNVEYLVAGQKVFVPIYDDSHGGEALMEISQKFPSNEVVALNCECLSELDVTLSDLILFAK